MAPRRRLAFAAVGEFWRDAGPARLPGRIGRHDLLLRSGCARHPPCARLRGVLPAAAWCDVSTEPAFPLTPPRPLVYHRLELSAVAVAAQIWLIVAPSTCYLHPEFQPGVRSWGLTAQLYGLRSRGDWGIGDFTDLARLCRDAAPLGAAVIGVNPLHALFAAEPRHFSPYSPSSRG